jgi:hypothetical protein
MSNIEQNKEDQGIYIPRGIWEVFLKHGKIGRDALELYIHYQFSDLLNAKNQSCISDKSCIEGLKWNKTKFKKAKNLLSELGIIQSDTSEVKK